MGRKRRNCMGQELFGGLLRFQKGSEFLRLINRLEKKMAGKSKKSKAYSLHPAKTIKPEEKTKAARKMHLDMKEKLLAERLIRLCVATRAPGARCTSPERREPCRACLATSAPTRAQIHLKSHYFHSVRRRPLFFTHNVDRGKNGINSMRLHDIAE